MDIPVMGAADALDGCCPNGNCPLKVGLLSGAARGVKVPPAAEDAGRVWLLEGEG